MSRVLRLKRNEKGRDYVVGDIHGMFSHVDQALEYANFDPEKDRLIVVGDLINRGSETGQVLDFLDRPYVYSVQGNNEDMARDILGAKNVYTNYESDEQRAEILGAKDKDWLRALSPEKKQKLLERLDELPIAIEVETEQGLAGIVHANVPHGLSWPEMIKKINADDKKTIGTVLWDRSRAKGEDNSIVEGVDQVFLGHTIADNVRQAGNCFFIDTGAFYNDEQGAVYYPEKYPKDWHLTLAEVGLKKEFYLAARPQNTGPVHVITNIGSLDMVKILQNDRAATTRHNHQQTPRQH